MTVEEEILRGLLKVFFGVAQFTIIALAGAAVKTWADVRKIKQDVNCFYERMRRIENDRSKQQTNLEK